ACSGAFEYPAPQKSVEAFVQAIAAFVRDRPGTLLLPMTELTTLPLSAQRDFLIAAGARLILPDHSDLLRAFNKNETTRLAASLGVAVPRTILVTSPEQAVQSAQELRFPVVLKPQASEELSPDGNLRTAGRPRYARDSAECAGDLRAEFAHRRIRDVYPTGSGSAVRVSAAVDPEIRRCSLAILAALHWHGVAMVEYRQKSGSPAVFMEVNGRFWHSLPLACYAGVDFPRLLVEMAEHGDVEPRGAYRSGIRCRWLLGDARHLAEVWKGPPRGYPGTY